MKVGDRHFRSIEVADGGEAVRIIDQRALPHRFEMASIETLDEAYVAIREMWVRGAPLIGVTAACGLALALRDDPSDDGLARAISKLASARPTAVNLRWALDGLRSELVEIPQGRRFAYALRRSREFMEEDVARNRAIGEQGLPLIRAAAAQHPGEPVQILTHCNAGWLATVDRGTATAPIFLAHEEGIPLHVWVSETRPRLQGAALTAWEMGGQGIDHTVVVDGAGASLMRAGRVDLVLVGSDRTTRTGDVVNKIGTYSKALAAADSGVPFYVALPSPTIDWSLVEGEGTPIEERDIDEVRRVRGLDSDGVVREIRITPESAPAYNPAFDVTPARLVTGLITERGVFPASEEGLLTGFPERVEVR